MTKANIFKIMLAAFIDLIVIFFIASLLASFPFPPVNKKIMLVSVFFLYNLTYLIFNNNRNFGMIALDLYWQEKYPFISNFLYVIFYTGSFATLFFSIFFPFDLFLANLIILQLPTIFSTGSTFHGLLAGNLSMVSRSKNLNAQAY